MAFFFQTPDHLMTGRAKNKDDLRMFLSRHFFDGFDHLPHPKGFLGQCGSQRTERVRVKVTHFPQMIEPARTQHGR